MPVHNDHPGDLMRSTLVSAVAAVMCLLLTPHAAAAESSSPTMYVPMPNFDGGEIVVQVNATPGSWQIRRSARRLAAQLDGVTVRTSGDCATADVCVTVAVGHYETDETLALSGGNHSGWGGLTTYPEAASRVIYLNTATTDRRPGDRRYTAAHEFGHVLGLTHHQSSGLMSDVRRHQTETLSVEELAVLTAAYSD